MGVYVVLLSFVKTTHLFGDELLLDLFCGIFRREKSARGRSSFCLLVTHLGTKQDARIIPFVILPLASKDLHVIKVLLAPPGHPLPTGHHQLDQQQK